MAWTINYTEISLKQLKKIEPAWQRKILDYMDGLKKPKDKGKPLTGNKKGLWRYRVGDYRIICQLNNKTVTILVLAVGHRAHIYDG